MQAITANTALCYIRRSGISQADLAQQKQKILTLCQTQGWKPEWYNDVPVTDYQSSISHRMAWARMMRRSYAADVVALVVSDHTYLYHDTEQLEALRQQLSERGIQLVIVTSQ